MGVGLAGGRCDQLPGNSRVYWVQRGPSLALWHTYVPHELRAKELDASDWNRYLAEEAKIFESVRTEVTQKLDPEDRIPAESIF